MNPGQAVRHGAAMLTMAAGAAVLAPAASAQSLAERVASAPDGTAHFSYESKPGVCGDGENISIIRDGETVMSQGRTYRMKDGRVIGNGRECVEGPVDVEITKSDGRITDVRVRVGGSRQGGGVEIGRVAPAEAVAFMLSDRVLRESQGDAAGRLVFGATLADAESWPQLLRAARDQSLPERPRKDAIFWLAQEAGDKAAEGLTSVIGNDSDELEIRKQAIFALSQIRGEASVDALIDVARTSREPEIRKNAIFWLGQSKDPRVLAFFEEVLRG